LVSYKSYTVYEDEELFIEARGEKFIYLYIDQTKKMYEPELGERYVYDGSGLEKA